MRDCGDCGAKPGGFHLLGCDVERCALCGNQAIACGCVRKLSNPLGEDDQPTDEMWEVYDAEVAKYGGRLAWDGEYPNSKECREANLYCYWESIPEPERSWAGRWVRCTKDHPEAIPDMNTFLSWARWDKVARKMVYRGISGYGGSPSN